MYLVEIFKNFKINLRKIFLKFSTGDNFSNRKDKIRALSTLVNPLSPAEKEQAQKYAIVSWHFGLSAGKKVH